MARHRALTRDNAARNKEDRREGATLSARTDAVSLNVTDRREGATLGARTNAVPLNKDEDRRRIAALGARADTVPLNNREGAYHHTRYCAKQLYIGGGL